jgi:3',5'-nucleoside bisphosphate phosphatase
VTTLRRTRVDLHSHTLRSDGLLEPLELYARMREAGMTLVAITDHDTLAGVRELRSAGLGGPASAQGPRIISGVEINTVPDPGLMVTDAGREMGELHVLGLGVDPDDRDLEAALAAQRAGRHERLERTLDVLAGQGLDVRPHLHALPAGARGGSSYGRRPPASESLGRPHVARALVAAGFAASVDDAFRRFLERGRPGWVPRLGMGPRDAIEAIGAARGIPVLAHAPSAPRAGPLIEQLMGWGLRGLEVHHRSFDEATAGEMGAFAEALGLLPTGGSDYHGDDMDYATALAGTFVPDSVGGHLLEALAR